MRFTQRVSHWYKFSRKRHKNKHWKTKGVLTSIVHKNRLYRKSIVKPNMYNSIKYMEYRKFWINVSNMQKNPTINKFWVIGVIQRKTCENILGRYLIAQKALLQYIFPTSGWERVTENHAIADAFNDFCSNVGSNLDRKISNQNTNFRHNIKKKLAVHSSLHQF